MVAYLTKVLKMPVEDLGPSSFDENDDYPDFARAVAERVAEVHENRGILICGSGHGVCIVANKLHRIRAVLGPSIESVKFARKDEDANIVCLAGRTLSDEHARAIVKTFLETPFSGEERHVRRLQKLAELE